MSAKDILASEPRDTRCSRLHDAHPECQCEKQSASPGLSPGIVQPGEILIRILPSPLFWDPKRAMPTTAAFSEVSTCGMSVTRRDHCSNDELNEQIHRRIKDNPNRSYGGLAAAKYDDIRDMKPDGNRAFCVYDTATELDHSHADVCQAHVPSPIQKTAQDRAMRRELQKKFLVFPWEYTPPANAEG